MTSLKQETIRGVKWAAIEKISVRFVQFVIGIILARLLAPSDFGAVGLLGIFLAISETFVDSGFSMALVRKQDRTEEDCSTMFYFSIIVAIVCYCILFAIAPLVSRFYDLPILTGLLRVQAIVVVINSFVAVQIAKLTINVDFKALAKVGLLTSVISGIVGIGMAYAGFGVWSLVAQAICAAFLKTILISFYLKWVPSTKFSMDSFKNLFSFGGNILGASLLTTIYNYIDSIVIGKFFSPTDFAYYSKGTTISRLPVESVNGVLSKVTFPIFSRIQDDKQLVSSYRKYIGMTSMVIFFGCCLMSALAEPLVNFLLTAKWSESVVYLQIFSFAIMFDHITNINLNLIKVKGKSDVILKLEIIKRIISFSILIAAIPFGVIGICISKVIYTQIALVINSYWNGKHLGMGYASQFKDYVSFLVLSVIACVPAYVITRFDLPSVVTLILGMGISCTIYWVMLRNNEHMKSLFQIIAIHFQSNHNEHVVDDVM